MDRAPGGRRRLRVALALGLAVSVLGPLGVYLAVAHDAESALARTLAELEAKGFGARVLERPVPAKDGAPALRRAFAKLDALSDAEFAAYDREVMRLERPAFVASDLDTPAKVAAHELDVARVLGRLQGALPDL